jgi:hypothetical protein
MPHPIKGASSPKVIVNITADHIATAKPRDSGHCMIADALASARPNAAYISVDLATVRFSDLAAGKRYIYLTPRAAQEALLNFDQGKEVEPFRMTLEHAHVLPTGNARNARAELTAGPGQKGVPIRVGGDSPPIGPLPGGAPRQRRRGAPPGDGAGAGNTRQNNSKGRRREFGLRAIIR